MCDLVAAVTQQLQQFVLPSCSIEQQYQEAYECAGYHYGAVGPAQGNTGAALGRGTTGS